MSLSMPQKNLRRRTLLQPSDTAPNLLRSILQSMDEESTNIILVCYERCLLSLRELSVFFHSSCSTYSTFPHETVFLSKLYPIRQNICTSNHKAEYSTFKSSVYFKKFRHPKGIAHCFCVSSTTFHKFPISNK